MNENPNVVGFLKNTQALRVINTDCATVKGNCRGTNQKRIDDLPNTPIPKRKSECVCLLILNHVHLIFL